MQYRRLLVSLLLLATVLVDCVARSMAEGQEFPHLTILLTWALQLSQVSLAAVWLGLGGRWGMWRMAAVVVVVAAWSYAMSTLSGAPLVEQWAVWLMTQTVAVSVPLLVGRSLGLRLVDIAGVSAEADSAPGTPRLQFSIRQMLGWTTALAVILGGLKCIAPYESLLLSPLGDWPMFIVFIGHALVGLAAVWAVLGTSRQALRIGALVLAEGAALGAFLLTLPSPDAATPEAAVLYFTQVLLLVGSLSVFRVAGYWLSWVPARS